MAMFNSKLLVYQSVIYGHPRLDDGPTTSDASSDQATPPLNASDVDPGLSS
jgi:hypothetical protein